METKEQVIKQESTVIVEGILEFAPGAKLIFPSVPTQYEVEQFCDSLLLIRVKEPAKPKYYEVRFDDWLRPGSFFISRKD